MLGFEPHCTAAAHVLRFSFCLCDMEKIDTQCIQGGCECRTSVVAGWLHGGFDVCVPIRYSILWLLPFTLPVAICIGCLVMTALFRLHRVAPTWPCCRLCAHQRAAFSHMTVQAPAAYAWANDVPMSAQDNKHCRRFHGVPVNSETTRRLSRTGHPFGSSSRGFHKYQGQTVPRISRPSAGWPSFFNQSLRRSIT